MNNIRPIEKGERWLLSGSAGSGKSYLGRTLANIFVPYSNVIYFDSKNEGSGKVETLQNLQKKIPQLSKTAGKIIRVLFDGMDKGDDELSSDLFTSILRNGNIVLWFDEAYCIPDTPPLRRIFTQGRTKNISVISCSQRPVGIPRVMISESTRFCIFNMCDKRDRDTVGAFVQGGVTTKGRFRFDYYDIIDDQRLNDLKIK